MTRSAIVILLLLLSLSYPTEWSLAGIKESHRKLTREYFQKATRNENVNFTDNIQKPHHQEKAPKGSDIII